MVQFCGAILGEGGGGVTTLGGRLQGGYKVHSTHARAHTYARDTQALYFTNHCSEVMCSVSVGVLQRIGAERSAPNMLPRVAPAPPRSHHTSLHCMVVAQTSRVPQRVWQVLRGLCRRFEAVSLAEMAPIRHTFNIGVSLSAACVAALSHNGPTDREVLGWPYLGTPFFGGGGQNFFAYCGRCMCIWTWVLKNFFLVYGPPNPWRGPGSQLQVPPGAPHPPPIWPLAS